VTRRAGGPLVLVVGLAFVASGCTATTVDPAVTTSGDLPTTIALAIDEGRDELLVQLDVELGALSRRISESDGEAEALARIDTLWSALQVDLQTDRPELVAGFRSVIDLARSAVNRRRPADADKARLNAEALFAAAAT